MSLEVPDVEWVKELAYKAGKLIRENFDEREKETKSKISSADLVTETDIAVENMLMGEIGGKYPTHKFLCEESSLQFQELTDDPTWVIDPVDGTMNFVHTLPFIAVSIGFCINKQIKLGVIYNPIMDEMFYASRNEGAYLLTKQSKSPTQLSVSPNRSLSHSIVATGFSVPKIRKLVEDDQRKKLTLEEIHQLEEIKEISFHNAQQMILHCRDLRRLGSCACDMAFVAAGRLDAMGELGCKEWDVCAGVLIIEEAGGVAINYDKTHPANLSTRQIIGASSMELALQLSDILKYPSFDQRTMEGS